MVVGAEHQNFLGVTHGGAMFSLADCAFALASNRAGARAVAIDTHLFLTGGSSQGDVLSAVAEETELEPPLLEPARIVGRARNSATSPSVAFFRDMQCPPVPTSWPAKKGTSRHVFFQFHQFCVS